MKILITGTSGYIGKQLVNKLQTENELYKVTRTVDKEATAGEFILWDMSTAPNLDNFPRDIDAVIHLAQSRNYRDLTTGAEDMFNVNVASTFSLIRHAVDRGVKYFCYISTGSVYESTGFPLEENNASTTPNTLLGASKYAAELLLHPFAQRINIGILRLFMPYGPEQTDRLLSNLIYRVKNKQPITVATTGKGSVFATSYIDDVVDVIDTAVKNTWVGTYNIASRSNVSIQEMGELIGSMVNEQPVFERDTAAKLVYFVPDLSKIAKLYPVDNMLNFQQGLEKIL
ncbi:NAD-dependent epimerase/dehydratase family protein [soil metagenome]